MIRLLLSFCFLFFYSSKVEAQLAPNFMVTDAHGNLIKLHEDLLDQDKTVVIELFFTSCPACKSIATKFGTLYHEWGSGANDVEFIALSVLPSDTDAKVRAYDMDYNIDFPGVSPEGGSLAAAEPYKDGTFGSYFGTPTFIVIAPDRTVNYRVRGSNNNATILAIDNAIAATGAVKPSTSTTVAVSGQVTTIGNRPIPNVKINLEGQANNFVYTNAQGNYTLNVEMEPGVTYTIEAEKMDNFREGITTLDLIPMIKNILHVDTFSSPYQFYIGDSNQNGRVSTLDLIAFRKLILSISQNINGWASPWKFLKTGITFSEYYNVPPNQLLLHFNDSDDLSQLNLIGLKAGDFNDSASLD